MNGAGGCVSVAKFQVGSGIDEYISQLQNLEYRSDELIGRAIYKGADIVADAIKANIQSLPASACSDVEKAGLLSGFGIAKMQDENGYFNVKAGFDGYNDDVTKKWPRGKPNSMIARSIEGGTSWKAKHPFIAPAVRATKDAAEKAMAEEIDKGINETMG